MRDSELHRAAEAMLAEKGCRSTRARRSLLDAVAVALRPLTAAEIATVAKQPASSVYRNLAVLVNAGVLSAIPSFDRQVRFEVAAALALEHCHHLICVRCGTVSDYVPPAQLESLVARLTPAVARAEGFELRHHTLDLLGVCAECNEVDAPSRNPGERSAYTPAWPSRPTDVDEAVSRRC